MVTITPSIPERFLRQLWKHQHLKTLALRTTRGEALSILSPGHPNPDAGPDFLNAVVTIGTITYRGDVELHYSVRDWHLHAHDFDPRYNRVILHVVFAVQGNDQASLTASNREVPLLHLAPFLSHSLQELWHTMILDERTERLARIKCFKQNDSVPAETIRVWLGKLALERLELKVRRFEERLRQLVEEDKSRVKESAASYGEIPFGLNPDELPPPGEKITHRDYAKRTIWAQLLYEGVLEALGYSKNREAFRRLARILPLTQLERILEDDQTPIAAEALLFGVSGLLPTGSDGPLNDRPYIRELQETWTIFRSVYGGEILESSDWKFFRLRPENFPTVRIAGAARLALGMIRDDYVSRIMRTIKTAGTGTDTMFRTIREMFIISADEFWDEHFRFGKTSSSATATLIGKDRANDIVLNAVVPLALLYARTFRDTVVREMALRLFGQVPSLSDNTIIRTMRNQLVKGRISLRSASLQQGTLQLYKHYCVGERCGECAVGKRVFST